MTLLLALALTALFHETPGQPTDRARCNRTVDPVAMGEFTDASPGSVKTTHLTDLFDGELFLRHSALGTHVSINLGVSVGAMAFAPGGFLGMQMQSISIPGRSSLGMESHPVTVAGGGPSLGHHVGGIVSRSTKKQMVRIDAGGLVTSVENEEPCRDGSIGKPPGKPVGQDECLPDAEHTIAEWSSGLREPIPTDIRTSGLHLRPKPEYRVAHEFYSCGIERQLVKTMADPDAYKVALTPKLTTIAYLSSLQAPPWDQNRPRGGPELQVWQVDGWITGYKREADTDYHLVLTDFQGHSMVVEIPWPLCAAGSTVLDDIAGAREAFEGMTPRKPSPTYKKLDDPIAVTVIGVGFFDKCGAGHQPTGSSDQCVEIHPVMSIRKR